MPSAEWFAFLELRRAWCSVGRTVEPDGAIRAGAWGAECAGDVLKG